MFIIQYSKLCIYIYICIHNNDNSNNTYTNDNKKRERERERETYPCSLNLLFGTRTTRGVANERTNMYNNYDMYNEHMAHNIT